MKSPFKDDILTFDGKEFFQLWPQFQFVAPSLDELLDNINLNNPPIVWWLGDNEQPKYRLCPMTHGWLKA